MKITQLSQLDLTKSYTIGDYLSWQFEEMVELIKGKIYNMSPAPRSKHQAISGNVYSEIYTLLKRKKCKVFHAPFDVYLKGMESDKDTVVQPDICVICDKSKIGEYGCIGTPDIIIEILSHSSMKRDLDYKFHLYEENGVKEYWIISPEYKQISIYILKENLYEHLGDFTTDDEYVFIHTLEQEKIKTSDIFEF